MTGKKRLDIVHTWRDGSYIYKGVLDNDTTDIGVILVGEKHSIFDLYEIRHLAGKTTAEWGELFHWIKLTCGGWCGTHLGQHTEKGLMHDYQIQPAN